MTVMTPRRLAVPGSAEVLEIVRDDDGHLRELRGGGRTYLRTDATGAVTVDGLCEYRETRSTGGFERAVTAGGLRWVERYAWEGERLVHVDGVDVRRDGAGRVVACLAGGVDPAPSSHRWMYGYAGAHLALIDGPLGARHVTSDPAGRPLALRDSAGRRVLRYDGRGVRREAAVAPSTWQRDAAGRLWTVGDRGGRVVATYLWDGYRCLGRIDGPPGAPLGAWFSLDPSATPVRIITSEGMRRVPRDAFGEGLLAESGVPGLFGGAVHGGLVHLPHRRLDPRSGAFCEPDPYDGGAADPRRVRLGSGHRPWTGAVPVESGDAGLYAVSRHDPVGRADPTGAISVPLLLSTPTWSSMNNIVSFVGMDWWFNLLASLFTGNQLADFFSSEALSSSERLGSFGVRRDGIISPITGNRAFTTQHIVWTPASEFDDLARGRVVDPQGTWEPTLYGSVLVARPEGRAPKVLRGMRNVSLYPSSDWLPSWTRAGGTAVPVTPGAVIPAFPSGGFHLDSEWLDLDAVTPTSLVEARPAGPPAVGDIEDRTVMSLPADGPGLDPGDLVLLSDAVGALAFATVASAGIVSALRVVRLEEQLTGIGPAGVRLREVDPAPLSRLTHDRGSVPEALEATGPAPYAPDDLLRVTPQVGGATLAMRVDHLEAQVSLDRAVPGTFSTPLRVRSTTVSAPLPATRRGVRSVGFASDAVAPPVGSFALLRGAGGELAVEVLAQTAGDERSVDVDLDTVAAADGDTFDFLPLAAGAELGTRPDGGPEAAATLTYRPLTAGTAPDGLAGSVVVRVDAAEGAAVRRVTGAPVSDAIICDRALPGIPPFDVERLRFQPGGLDRDGLTITTASALVLRPAIDPVGTAALRLLRLAADPPAVGGANTLPGATLVDGRVEAVVSSSSAAIPNRPEPGDVVLLNGTEIAGVDRVSVAFTADRDLDLPAGLGPGEIEVVPLADDGFAWLGEIVATDRVRLSGEAWQLSAATADPDPGRPRRTVDFPRVGVGETVRLRSTSGGAITTDVHRVTAVEGTTVTLAGGDPLTVGATDVSVRRVVPDDPATGGSRLGRGGDVVSGRRVRVDVWDPRDLSSGSAIGIVAGDRTLPAVVDTPDLDITVTFTAPVTAAAGPVTVDLPTVRRAAHVTNFLRDGDVLVVTEPLNLSHASGPIAGDTIVAQRLVAVGDEAAARTSGGTLLVPEDEPVEIDRRQSLIDHELTHTLQYGRLGPWWFAFFPLWALELGLELGTDTDLPTYSAFTAARWTRDDNFPGYGHLVFTGAALDLDEGDTLQLVRGSETRTMKVTSLADGIRLKGSGKIPTTPLDGPVQARVRNADDAWDAIFNILQHTSHGGLVGQIVGSSYGSLLYGIGKLFYALGRVIFGKGDLYPVTVSDDRRDLTLTDDAGREAFRGPTERMVTVRNGETTVVRRAARDGDVLHLDEPVPLGWEQVQAAPYDTHDPGSAWDWLDYHPARVPDPAIPYRVELVPVDGETPSLGIRDRVEVNYRGAGKRTTVISADGATLELEDPIVIEFDERSLRIAKVDEGDPMGNADSTAILALGMGWMRWLFDPWGQLQVRIDASETWQQVLLRTARYLFGSQSWSVLPLFGYVFYDRILFHSDQFGYRARIEQEAAEESGDLYSPLGRLLGEVGERDGFAQRGMVVGDVARYRFWPNSRSDTFVDTDRQMAPGVHLDDDDLRWLPFVVQTATSSAPNGTAEADATQPVTRAVPDLLAAKDATDPDTIPETGPIGLAPSQRAFVPTSPTCQRTLSGYVAWTRPGTHRTTTRNGITSASDAQDLHARGADGIFVLEFWEQQGLQTLWYEIEVSDVAVSLAGQAVAEGATVDLLVHQESTVAVGPVDGGRAYAVNVVDPSGGTVRSPRASVLAAGPAVGTEDVEISRVHRDSGGYATGGLAAYGFHLGGDVHVPVRRFTANVVDTVPVRSAAAPTAPVVTDLAPGGEVFVLVPAPIVTPLRIATVDGASPAAGADLPTISAVDPVGAAATFVGATGAVFRISAPDDAPPAARALGLEIVVGPAGAGVPVTAALNWTT